MAIFLFSLIGLPLTAGFVGKFLLFVGAFSAPSDTPTMRNLYQLLAVIAAINAAVGAFYYLRVIGVMYLRTPLRPVTGVGFASYANSAGICSAGRSNSVLRRLPGPARKSSAEGCSSPANPDQSHCSDPLKSSRSELAQYTNRPVKKRTDRQTGRIESK